MISFGFASDETISDKSRFEIETEIYETSLKADFVGSTQNTGTAIVVRVLCDTEYRLKHFFIPMFRRAAKRSGTKFKLTRERDGKNEIRAVSATFTPSLFSKIFG